MHLVCQALDISEFKDYVLRLKFNGWTPSFVVVHNTSVPNQALYKKWHDKSNWTMQQWGRNLASYYAGMGWNGCPHLFVGYDKILVMNDLTYPGTHSPSWNKISWGVETIGEFENESFDGGVKSNLISALVILHSRIGLLPDNYKLGVRGLHFHKEDVHTTHKTCPGKNISKAKLVSDILAEMNNDFDHVDIPKAVHEADTQVLSPYELISIHWLQSNLNTKFGTLLIVDDKLGDKTKKAVSDFQKEYNLTVDGIAGPLTRLKLKEI